MSKPTPGPWEAKGSTVYEVQGGKNKTILYRIADCSETGDHQMDDANARLIAAAPELLEAAWEAFQILLLHEERPREVGDGYAIARESLRAAIAKAEGR